MTHSVHNTATLDGHLMNYGNSLDYAQFP